ncbi:MAG TPA: hypothetical protein VG345_14410, partial [Bryobacteraceae bacterium]|nr:hypothetical protein [Bryobacteraceae bacterium]
IRTTVFLFCCAMLALPQNREGIPNEREARDRVAIGRVIASLNEPSQRNNAFAHAGDAPAQYAELRRSIPALEFRILGPGESTGAPIVKISHEPWGEAEIALPPPPRPVIVFIGPDVALAEGGCAYAGADGLTQINGCYS